MNDKDISKYPKGSDLVEKKATCIIFTTEDTCACWNDVTEHECNKIAKEYAEQGKLKGRNWTETLRCEEIDHPTKCTIVKP
ncbi:hypothetical protein OB969_22435 [Bacillus cereus]|uniref:hypothetical protein n=1 Tax=Bacillus pseudomycoides TaxID=64104 RepID=UPI000BF7DB2A|nr:hypothetical protein [Bacillus pseudomycoides]MCU5053364.1 hypothetical protein [Bacillus cereus]MBD5799427.1 hypothetical protein [Bacillus pseudomycoides]MCU5189885.1 hypothetical protein [Bacillus cereus]MED1473352.1 hypothetical protein [Bacillus pseudomycoides]PEO86551.1 hypothetical protein CN571_19600 [Bacillus pseudomycoides]